MRVAIVPESGDQSASTRHRALQHVPRLRERLGEVDVLLPADDVPPPRNAADRARFFAVHARRCVERARGLRLNLPSYDAVLVQRGAYPLGPGWVIHALDGFEGRVVLDLDDAVFMTSPALRARSAAARWLYGPQQSRRVLGRADAVIASTPAVAESLPGGRRADAILPTVPDPSRYATARARREGPLRLIWAGNAGNLGYLDPLAGPLARLRAEGIAELEVVCSRPWSGPARFRRWRLEDETAMFADADVGLMPLPDTPYTRAKAGFKLLQYMAAGLAVIASPVGINHHLVGRSGAGMLAHGEAQWERAIRQLASSATLREALGGRGRVFVCSYVDLDAQAAAIAGLLRGDARPSARPAAARTAGSPTLGRC
jgi:glycosyl transferase family 1